MVTPEALQGYIAQGLSCEHLQVDGDGHHFEAVIVCAEFEGKRPIARHQMVYAVLGDRMKAEIHALSIENINADRVGREQIVGRQSIDVGQSPENLSRWIVFRILGGAPLSGEVRISGAKNAALPILCASLLTSEPLVLSNIPRLRDVSTMKKLLVQMGSRIELTETQSDGQEAWALTSDAMTHLQAPYELVKTMRASVLVLGPMLARFGEALVSLPGGCAIGQRPVDQHIKGLAAMGADIQIEHGYIKAQAKRLRGARIVTDMVTVTGTENLMMAAVLAEGTTVLDNAAREPEVVDLANCLIAMGARIEGAGSDRIVIHGVDRLHGARYPVMADRIEAGTFICAVAATGGDVLVRQANSAMMGATLEKLRESGVSFSESPKGIRVTQAQRPKAFNFRTAPFTGPGHRYAGPVNGSCRNRPGNQHHYRDDF